MNPQSPKDNLQLDEEEERCKDKDEPLVVVLKFLVIVSEGIDAGRTVSRVQNPYMSRGIRASPQNFGIVPFRSPAAFQCEATTSGIIGYTTSVITAVRMSTRAIAGRISFMH
ncbi:MAG: hypothetical protein NTV10_00265 [Methanoregula sp.]|nr:hypothetical protein [Methanoregula sp.]